MGIPIFETTFAVPLRCDACVKDVSQSLYKIEGIKNVTARLQDQLVSVEGNVPPSVIAHAIQVTGRDAIVRGTGEPNSAAVCILETHSSRVTEPVRGLIRIVQVAPAMSVFDIAIKGLSPGTYQATIREGGDISRGPESTGGAWGALDADMGNGRSSYKGGLGLLDVNRDGIGAVFASQQVGVWEMIGRSIVVSKYPEETLDKEDPDTLVGVIARSSGVWDNDKTVCSCSGKTVWEERKEQVDKGML